MIYEYDRAKLKQARGIINDVYSFYYRDINARAEQARLETIVRKLDELISLIDKQTDK